MSPLLNYTTQVDAVKTVGEISKILAAHGAKTVLTEYDNDGAVEALSFTVNTPHGDIGFRLPVDAEATFEVLKRQNNQGKVPTRFLTHTQAIRIAWRIIKDWVSAQMALLETEAVRLEQIFLPYMIIRDGQTLYDAMVERQFLLDRGRDLGDG